MLDTRRLVVLCAGGALFWIADVAWIRLVPAFAIGPFWGDLAFPLSVPVAWTCVRLCRRLAGLDGALLVPGMTLLVIVAALPHAVALRWAPALYGGDHAARLGSAWLLWIYGLILGFALLPALRAGRTRSPAAGDETVPAAAT